MKSAVREIVIIVVLTFIFFIGIRAVVHNFEVKGRSMEPTLHNGQYIIVSKASYWFGDPQRGDIVVFDTVKFNHGIIHRIVGLPGELVEIKKGTLCINDQEVRETYIQGNAVTSSRKIVPDNSYFIVGDNRQAASSDIVKRENIIGKAWLSYWPISEWGLAPNYSWDLSGNSGKEVRVESVKLAPASSM